MKTVGCLRGAMFVAALSLLPAAHADLGFPDYVKFPPQIQVNPDQRLIKETLAEAEFPTDKTGATKAMRRGAHYARWYYYKPAAGEPAAGFYNGTEERIYKAMQAAFARDGWQQVHVNAEKDVFTMRLARGGRESWLIVKADAPQAQVFVELIEVGSAASNFSLPSPAAKPEKVADKDDLPYLLPYPGSTRKGVGRSDGPLDVSLPGKSGSEPQMVGTAVVTRSYQGPGTLSKLQFASEYRDALVKAGWKMIYPIDDKTTNEADILIAHYTRDGRDIWAKLFYEYGASISFSVVDVGGEDWAAKFERDCRLPLYGVFFDFNKATLKPESEPVLNKAASLLKGKTFGVEVQGHTDNVGGEDYNLKLSDARAASVKTWLAQHGIEAARMSSKGYGKTQPVADNGSDEGRARNRRVELVRTGCRKG
ncbi:MAG: OmpA family protein [Betaproteobacteria bacterium]|nr:OmpA family protein [Betaproteobacteria bacterium]